MKAFVGLARDRSQGLMASPSATAGDHLRTLALLCLILSFDLAWVVRCVRSRCRAVRCHASSAESY